jgi:hypothetical protein
MPLPTQAIKIVGTTISLAGMAMTRPGVRPPAGRATDSPHLPLRRRIGPWATPSDQFFFIQHYNKPEIDGDAYQLKFTGLVSTELSLADLRQCRRST